MGRLKNTITYLGCLIQPTRGLVSFWNYVGMCCGLPHLSVPLRCHPIQNLIWIEFLFPFLFLIFFISPHLSTWVFALVPVNVRSWGGNWCPSAWDGTVASPHSWAWPVFLEVRPFSPWLFPPHELRTYLECNLCLVKTNGSWEAIASFGGQPL